MPLEMPLYHVPVLTPVSASTRGKRTSWRFWVEDKLSCDAARGTGFIIETVLYDTAHRTKPDFSAFSYCQMVILRIRKKGIVQMCNALVCRADTSNGWPLVFSSGRIPFLKAVRAPTRTAFLMPLQAYAVVIKYCQRSLRHYNIRPYFLTVCFYWNYILRFFALSPKKSPGLPTTNHQWIMFQLFKNPLFKKVYLNYNQ